MDFLTLLVCYVLTSMAIILAYLAGDSPILSSGHIGYCRTSIHRGLVWGCRKLPQPLYTWLALLYYKVFFQKNAIFQLLYVAMVVGGHVVLVVDCLPYLYTVDTHRNHVTAPSVCLFLNAIFFFICCYTDAGIITKENINRYSNVYIPDGVLYQPEAKCSTCELPKPARSKHCAVSDRCYFKFDHYCMWTSNVVAGLNHRWFMLFLLSVIVMCLNAIVMAVTSLINITSIYELMTLRYLDASGLAQPMTYGVLLQTLFMQFPRVVSMAAGLMVISALMVGFILYHTYLICTNQTTNERYKRRHVSIDHHPYSRGLLANLCAEVAPLWWRLGAGVSARDAGVSARDAGDPARDAGGVRRPGAERRNKVKKITKHAN